MATRNGFLIGALALAGCHGQVGDPGATTEPPPADTDGGVVEPGACTPAANPGNLRRLTSEQVENTLVDLFGQAVLGPEVEEHLVLLVDERAGNFAVSLSAPDTQTVLTQMAIAEAASSRVDLDALAGCARSDDACALEIIESWGTRIFRRPLDAIDPGLAGAYAALFAEERAASDADTATRLVLAAMLSSPNFLYHSEMVASGGDAALVPIDGWSVASRLSFMLWASTPDDALLEAARSGALATGDGIAIEVRRMLDDPRAGRGMRSFFAQWLKLGELDHIAIDDAAWRPGSGASLREGTLRFVEEAVAAGPGGFTELLSGSFAYVDAETAPLHGVSAMGAGFSRVELDPAERAGLMTLPGWLLVNGEHAEIHRGLFVREQLLCDPLPPPPDGAAEQPIEDRLAVAECAACHRMMDPIGRAFGSYDPLGRFDPGHAAPAGEVVASGIVTEAAVVGSFESPGELGARLAESRSASRCMSVQWFRYALGRSPGTADACAVDRVANAFEASGRDLTSFVVALATEPEFRSLSAEDVR